MTVNGCESDVSDLIDVLELVHCKLTDKLRREFALGGALKLTFDAFCDALYQFKRNGAFFAGSQKSREELVFVERFSRPVSLYDDYWRKLYGFICGETLSAACAFSSAPDAFSDRKSVV